MLSQVSRCINVLDECSLCRRQTISLSRWTAVSVRGLHPHLCLYDRTAGLEIHLVVASNHQWLVGLEWQLRHRMQVWRIHRWFRCTPAAKKGHCITTSKGVLHQQGDTLVRTNSFGDLTRSDQPEALPSSKDSQQFKDVEAIGWRHNQDYHVCINCAYWHIALPFLNGIL